MAAPVHVGSSEDDPRSARPVRAITPTVVRPGRSPWAGEPARVRIGESQSEPRFQRRVRWTPELRAERRSRVLLLACWCVTLLVPTLPAVFLNAAPGPGEFPQHVRDLAAFFWLLCLLPALHYIALPARERRPFPFMPLIGLLFGLYYPLVPLSGVDNLMRLGDVGVGALDPQHDYARPLRIALDGWVLLCASYLLTIRAPLPGTGRIGRIGARVPAQALKPWAFCFLYGSMAFDVTYRVLGTPFHLMSAVHFALVLGHLGVVLLVALSVQRRLSLLATLALYAGFGGSVFLQLSSGATWKVTYLLFSYFLGRWIVRRHLGVAPLLAGLCAIVFFTMVRGAMTDWRNRVWYASQSGLGLSDTGVDWHERSVPDQSMLMMTLLERQVADSGLVGAARHSWSVVARRATLDLLADAVRRTPDAIPYWDGVTYHSLIGFAVPRFFWPDKPMKTLGQDFGHRYGYLADDDLHTAINLPFLVEFYINFGERGVLWGMCLVGVLFAILERYVNQPGQSLFVTLGGAALFFPLLNIENDFSLQFGGLFLHAVALRIVAWGIELVSPRLTQRSATRTTALLWPPHTPLLTVSSYFPTKLLGSGIRRRLRRMLAAG